MIPFRCTEIIHHAFSLSVPVVVGTPKISNINNYIYAIQLITSVMVAIYLANWSSLSLHQQDKLREL